MVVAFDVDRARGDAGGDHDIVEAGEAVGVRTGGESQDDAGVFDALVEVAQGLVEFFLARNGLGEVELAADAVRGIEQGDAVPAFRGHGGAGQAGRTGADHRDRLGRRGLCVVQFGFRAGARIDQAARGLVLEHMVQARLVAGDAGIDAIRASAACLVHPFGVGQQGTRHRHHVGCARGEDRLGDIGHVDPVGRDQWHAYMRLQLGGHARECRAWHRGRDGRYARLVPADAGIDDGGASGFDRLGLGDDVLPAVAAFDQVEHRQAIDQDEIRAAGLAHLAHDLHREAHPLGRIAAPGIGASVRARRGELVQQVALRTHHFDAVVAGVAGQAGGGGEIADVALDAAR